MRENEYERSLTEDCELTRVLSEIKSPIDEGRLLRRTPIYTPLDVRIGTR